MKITSKLVKIFVAGLSVFTAGTTIATPDLTSWEEEIPGEEESARDLGEKLIRGMEKDYVNKSRRVLRDAHSRGIGCVEATFEVDRDLPVPYRAGVFKVPGKSYSALIRFSNSLGPAGDNVRDARGMAIKVIGIPGAKLLQSQEDAMTQDFLQIDAPFFPARDALEFAAIFGLKENPASIAGFLAAKPVLRARELKALFDLSFGNPNNGKSLAERTFFSQTAYLLKGPSINIPIKFASIPCGPVTPMALDGTGAELRSDLAARLADGEVCYRFAIQEYKSGVGFSVEDGMNKWDEAKSPLRQVATIRIPKQQFLTDEKLRYCDNLSFQPWHALPEHRPLGNINRSRKIIYEMISNYRHLMNREDESLTEPTSLDAWHALESDEYTDWRDITVPAGR
ncbi:MAG: catalase [Deltaproteobacteria bacterium]|nr:catalase [Deltaproteobacteria bacterium]